jgi:D-alanyl-D-alanine carboxypeptidase
VKKALLLTLAVMLAANTVAADQPPRVKTPEDVLRYISIHRQNAALVTFTAAPDGSPDPADPIVFHNADVPMPLASTIKVVVLAAYAREVVAGRVDPKEAVAVGDWERFYLAGLDGGAHSLALADLKIPTDEHGFSEAPGTIVPLDKVVRAMIRRSDNAATDFVMQRLGRSALRATIAEARLSGQDLPLPFLGLFLSWTNHEEGSLKPGRVRRLQALSRHHYIARVDRFVAAFQDEAWRQEELQAIYEGRLRHPYELETLVAGTLSPMGTARDYARIMAGVVTGTFLSPEISAVMRPHLERDLLGATGFESIGFKGGRFAGALTEAIWFVPSEGDFAGKPRVVILFQRNLHVFPWALLVRDNGQAFFGIQLGKDRAFAEETERAFAEQP